MSDKTVEDVFEELNDEFMDDVDVIFGMSDEEEEVMSVFENHLEEYEGREEEIPADVWDSVDDVTNLLLIATNTEGSKEFRVQTLPDNSYLFEWFENNERVNISVDDVSEIDLLVRERFESSECNTIVYDGWGLVVSYDTPEEVVDAVKEHFITSKRLGLIPTDAPPEDYITEIEYDRDRGFSINHWIMESEHHLDMSRYIINLDDGYGTAAVVDVDWDDERLYAFADSLKEKIDNL